MVQLDHDGWLEVTEKFAGPKQTKDATSILEAFVSQGSKQPINILLQGDRNKVRLRLQPRQYQELMFQEALLKNVIIYLGTGLGKTYIVVLFLNSPLIGAEINSGRKVVFLAPTIDLVRQQAEYVFRMTPYKIRIYCGRTYNTGLHVDHWNEEIWVRELAEIDILFMTPAIFANAICTGFFKWSNFSAVIFDEVHHACKSRKKKSASDYCRILSNNRDSIQSTRLIGLTASMINHMPKDSKDIRIGVEHLEALLKAEVVTDIHVNESKPRFVIHSFHQSGFDASNDILVNIFEGFAKEIQAALELGKNRKKLMRTMDSKLTSEEKQYLAFHNKLNLSASGFSIKPGSFYKILRQLSLVRETCGLWVLANICFKLVKALERHGRRNFLSAAIRPIYSDFAAIFEKILAAISIFLGKDSREILLDYTQPKLQALLEVLKHEHDAVMSGNTEKSTFSCIVFVKSRIMVLAICNWLREISTKFADYGFIKTNYAIGLAATANSKWSCITKRKYSEQAEMLDNFRQGLLNVIVTTSVLEEGIDLPICSTVIRFDEEPTFRAFVQSRGRARQLKSSYIILSNHQDTSKTNLNLRKFNDFEYQLKLALTDASRSSLNSADQKRLPTTVSELDREDVFSDPQGKFRIDTVTAKVILHMYCAGLSRKHPFSCPLQYEILHPNVGTFQTRLFLPTSCPVRSCLGGEKNSNELANSSAVVAAIRALYEANELDEDHAIPIRAMDEHIDGMLDKLKLKPEMSPLSADLEGEIVKIGDRELIAFRWKLTDLEDCLSRGCSARRYKMLKIVFHPENGRVREDTKVFFSNAKYGLILDQSVPTDAWPKQLFNHYGEFAITYEPIESNMVISDRGKHNEYFNYTHKILTKCCNLSICRDDFKRRCLFYLVPLDNHDKIKRIDPNAFIIRNADIRESEIVIESYYYRSKSSNPKLYLVKRVRSDMNIMSAIPGRKDTFYDMMVRNYGAEFIRETNQPVLEVMPISREFARSSAGKRARADYSSRNLFFLRQQLEFFHHDPALVFQAFNMPEIIYRIYLTATIVELEQKFIRQTAEDRSHVVMNPVPFHQGGDVFEANDEEAGAMSGDENDEEMEAEGFEEGEEDGEGMDHEEDEADMEDEEGDYSSSLSDDRSQDSDYDDHELAPRDQLKEIVSRRAFSLKDDDDRMEHWNLDEYKSDNLQALDIVNEESHHHQRYIDSSPRFSSSFGTLKEEIYSHQQSILQKLRQIHQGILSDTQFNGDEERSARAERCVDLNIEPSLKFDRNATFIKPGSRVEALLEAVTQRRASPTSNLELLENIGDCYLKYLISVALFKLLEDQPESVMTSARSRLIGNKNFTYLAKKSSLGSYAISNKYDASIVQWALNGRSLDNQADMKNVMRPKDLADTFESIVGAYLTTGGEFEAILAINWLGLDVFTKDMFAEFHETSVAFAKSPSALLADADTSTLKIYRLGRKSLEPFEQRIGYKFNDPSYLIQALTHASAVNRCTESYERLEFLGDAILDFLVTMTLHQAGLNTPGQLTSSRSALVNNANFAKLALQYGFHYHLQYANQELYDELVRVNDTLREDPEMNFFSMVDYDKIVKLLGDIFESVAAAIYLDSACSLDKIWSIYYPMLKESIDEEVRNPTKNSLVRLYEIFPGRGRVKIEYFDIRGDESATGAKCTIHGYREFFGEGLSKHQAKLRAVDNALKELPTAADKAKLDRDFLDHLKSSGGDRPRERGPGVHRGARRGGRGGRCAGQRGRGGVRCSGDGVGYSRGRAARGNWRLSRPSL